VSVEPNKIIKKQWEQNLQEEFDALKALDEEWRNYFASQEKPPLEPTKLETPQIILCE